MGLRGRLRRLEESNAMGDGPVQEPQNLEEREAIIAELRQLEEKHGPLWERAEREAAAGDTRRLEALEELEAAVRRRAEE